MSGRKISADQSQGMESLQRFCRREQQPEGLLFAELLAPVQIRFQGFPFRTDTDRIPLPVFLKIISHRRHSGKIQIFKQQSGLPLFLPPPDFQRILPDHRFLIQYLVIPQVHGYPGTFFQNPFPCISSLPHRLSVSLYQTSPDFQGQ